jgi:hypothetical protein
MTLDYDEKWLEMEHHGLIDDKPTYYSKESDWRSDVFSRDKRGKVRNSFLDSLRDKSKFFEDKVIIGVDKLKEQIEKKRKELFELEDIYEKELEKELQDLKDRKQRR